MKSFKIWTPVKVVIQNKNVEPPFIHQREIWYAHLGENIGFEEDGKGKDFLRPVLIYRIFNKNIFWGIPLTTKGKDIKCYAKIEENSFAILSQIKLIDTKRLSHKIITISQPTFDFVNKKLKDLMP